MAEVIDVAVRTEATNEPDTGWRINRQALGADGHFAVISDADVDTLTPDKGPPWAVGGGTQDRAVFGAGLETCGGRSGAEFAVDFMLVDVGQELVEQAVGAFEFQDAVSRQEGRQAFLPVVMTPFDFTLGLRGGGEAQGDAIEVERGTQLGEGVGVMGVEEGVVVDIEGQGQAVGLEGAGQEIEVGEQDFAGIEAGAGVVACGVVQDVKEGLFTGVVGQPGMGADVVLPESALLASLPAFDGFGRGFVAGVGSEFVFEDPATDAGAVGLEVQPAVEFAGDGTVGARRL